MSGVKGGVDEVVLDSISPGTEIDSAELARVPRRDALPFRVGASWEYTTAVPFCSLITRADGFVLIGLAEWGEIMSGFLPGRFIEYMPPGPRAAELLLFFKQRSLCVFQ